MNKKEFIIPIAAIIVLVLIGVLLVVHSKSGQTPAPQQTATSTATSTISTTPSASTGSGTPSYYPYGTVTLSLNQVAGFQDGISIRPVAVLEDSRCPIGVQCIQAGTVRISLRTSATDASLTTAVTLNKPATVGGDTITLTSVTPVPTKDTVRPSDSAYRFTFSVEPHQAAAATGQCYISGCSAQLCTDEPGAISTCEYRPEYACYKTATCERQTTGKCGWTQSPALTACLANPPAAS